MKERPSSNASASPRSFGRGREADFLPFSIRK
jgi:hypothetical protein